MTLNEFKKLPHDYLGDGAYICYTGYSFIIVTTNGMFIENEVHLEKSGIESLNRFVARMETQF